MELTDCIKLLEAKSIIFIGTSTRVRKYALLICSFSTSLLVIVVKDDKIVVLGYMILQPVMLCQESLQLG